jgi:hypothetical protein
MNEKKEVNDVQEPANRTVTLTLPYDLLLPYAKEMGLNDWLHQSENPQDIEARTIRLRHVVLPLVQVGGEEAWRDFMHTYGPKNLIRDDMELLLLDLKGFLIQRGASEEQTSPVQFVAEVDGKSVKLEPKDMPTGGIAYYEVASMLVLARILARKVDNTK